MDFFMKKKKNQKDEKYTFKINMFIMDENHFKKITIFLCIYQEPVIIITLINLNTCLFVF